MLLARFILAEILKLRRSLVLLLGFSSPLLVAVICVLIGLRGEGATPIDRYSMTGAAFWAFAMLPLSITALSVLMAQMEHGPKAWDHLLALPGGRRWLFLAKAAVLMLVIFAMSAWLLAALAGGAALLAALKPVTGAFNWTATGSLVGRMALAAGLMAMLQLWAALHFRSFVPPLVLGILGTFIAVAAASAREGAYFPWLMPLHLLSTDPAMALTALRIGAYGGLAALAAMLLHLGRRESI